MSVNAEMVRAMPISGVVSPTPPTSIGVAAWMTLCESEQIRNLDE